MKYSPTIAAFVFAVLAVIAKWKFIPLEYNFALFGALSLFCGAYLRGWGAWLLPVGALLASDIFGHFLRVPGVHLYGATSMLFNYLGFAAMIGIGHYMRRRPTIDIAIPTVLAGSLAYFVISNFGSFLDPQLKYEQSLAGLWQCYALAIPYYRTTFQSDVVFSFAMFGCHHLATHLVARSSTERSEA
jgi:hypothetical protein